MKKIYLAILCAMTGLTFQSCLHDDKEFFDDSAANRIENTVENTQKVLESSENGWELHYYTGEGYTGGGYTFLLKFHNGKVTVAGDPALATSEERATSSYGMDRSMGPVLTFNTYNHILHALGTPNINNIQGQQGDWEFVVTKLTEDSIFVRGKKWSNDMVFTRLPQTVDWKEHLDSIGNVAKQLKDNYVDATSGDASKAIEVNASTRRIAGRNALGQVEECPYIITTKGIQTLEPVTVGNSQTQSFELTQTGKLQTQGDAQVELAPYIAPIDTWVGKWSLSAVAGSCDLTISKCEEKADSLIATFKVDTLEYHLGMNYDAETGYAYLNSQYISDPSGKYPALFFMSADLSHSALLGAGGVYFVWHCVSQEATFIGDVLTSTKDGSQFTVDSFVAGAADSQGNLLRDEDDLLIFPVEWYYLYSLSRN